MADVAPSASEQLGSVPLDTAEHLRSRNERVILADWRATSQRAIAGRRAARPLSMPGKLAGSAPQRVDGLMATVFCAVPRN
jgi:hypothetical protein